MKWSPPWAVTPNTAVESPKPKHSGRKGGHHCSLGHSSNTSTLKHPDSTSAKKPSSSKEPVPKEQDKSPRSRGSCKCGCSPSPSAESHRHKQKEACTEDTHKLNFTLPLAPVGLMAFTVQWDPTARQLSSILPPSPQPPWVLAPLDNGDLHLKKVGTC